MLATTPTSARLLHLRLVAAICSAESPMWVIHVVSFAAIESSYEPHTNGLREVREPTRELRNFSPWDHRYRRKRQAQGVSQGQSDGPRVWRPIAG